MARLVLLGRITGAHGVAGLVKLQSFTADPMAIFTYGPLSDGAGSGALTLKPAGATGKALLARVEGIADRTQAEALAGRELWLPRDRLPPPDDPDEVYLDDLVGLALIHAETAERLGQVRAVPDFGAGPVLEVALDATPGRSEYWPFSLAVVPEIDLPGGRLLVHPPVLTGAEPDDPAEGETLLRPEDAPGA